MAQLAKKGVLIKLTIGKDKYKSAAELALAQLADLLRHLKHRVHNDVVMLAWKDEDRLRFPPLWDHNSVPNKTSTFLPYAKNFKPKNSCSMWFNLRFGLPTELSDIHLTSKDGSNAKDWYDLVEAAGYIAMVDSEDPQPVGAFVFLGKYTVCLLEARADQIFKIFFMVKSSHT